MCGLTVGTMKRNRWQASPSHCSHVEDGGGKVRQELIIPLMTYLYQVPLAEWCGDFVFVLLLLLFLFLIVESGTKFT